MAEAVLLPLVIQSVLRGPFTGVPIILKAGLDLDLVVRLRLWTCVPALAFPALGAFLGGAVGAAWGLVASAVIIDAICVAVLRARKSGQGMGQKYDGSTDAISYLP